AHPGGDLAGIWWDLVASLQGLRRPEGRTAPDWASKIHLAVAPVYYQSYLLGELLASQLDQAVREHAGGFVDRPAAAPFLPAHVLRPRAPPPPPRAPPPPAGHRGRRARWGPVGRGTPALRPIMRRAAGPAPRQAAGA